MPDRATRRTAEGSVSTLLSRCSFPPAGTAVTCAFSGGADSTALIVLAAAAGCAVTAIHVDHGLRPDSAAAAVEAGDLAAMVGVAFRSVRIDVDDGPNLEARARTARFGALPPGVLTGHTADDRAETLLINLLRGCGLDGLSAMGPAPTRPLLGLRRADTRALCAALGLSTVDDPSNADARFVRNRVRHELLPLMTSIADRDIVALLVRTADLAADDVAQAEADADRLDPTDARAVAAAPTARARRAVRRWLSDAGHPPDSAAVERVLDVARGQRRACEIIGGRRVERHRQRLRIIEPGQLRSPDGMEHTDAWITRDV